MELSLSQSVSSPRWSRNRRLRWIVFSFAISAAGVSSAIAGDLTIANLAPYGNDSGVARTYSTAGAVDLSTAFFRELGANGRSCVTCHQPGEAWSVAPAHIRERFEATHGLDPIFRTNDGADCPSADVSTVEARRGAYTMLLSRGVFRVTMPLPRNADFSVDHIEDPYNCSDNTTAALAMFRRPLPSANLRFLTTVMWDGRESLDGEALDGSLTRQAVNATIGHAEAFMIPSPEDVAQILHFELSAFTAQTADKGAKDLNARGAKGGPLPLSKQKFYVGINDPLGGNPTGEPFNPVVFTLFSEWSKLQGPEGSRDAARASIARGEALFNTLQFTISGVTGLNDLPMVGPALQGTCTTCHDTPNVGNHSVPLAINIGVSDYPALPALDTTGLPVYTITCSDGATGPLGQGRTFQTTDPARAMVTGRCADVGKTKGPILRGLAARPPYFHNGSAATLRDVVEFYDQRFSINLTEREKKDLVAFLQAL